MDKPIYKRVLLKISGEALSGAKGNGFDADVVNDVVAQIKSAVSAGVQIGVVVGGGNFWRGRQGTYMESTTADYMGMLATCMNALALCDALNASGVGAIVQTALKIEHVAEEYNKNRAICALENGKVVIFACGTGHPFFSTDTAAALRSAEIGADVLLLAKNVDGIYDSDPKINPNAKIYKEISYVDFICNRLKAMDTTAVTICMDNNTPILAFGFKDNSIYRAACGEDIGTWIR